MIDDILVVKSYHRSSESAGVDIGTYEREIKKSRVFFSSHKEREIRAGWIIFYYFMIIIGLIIFCHDSFHWNLGLNN